MGGCSGRTYHGTSLHLTHPINGQSRRFGRIMVRPYWFGVISAGGDPQATEFQCKFKDLLRDCQISDCQKRGQKKLSYSLFLCRTASYIITPAATETLSEPICPLIGMAANVSQRRSISSDMPLSSAPITMATGPVKSASV